MRPVKIEFQAFGPYAEHEMVDFEAISKNGLFLICGKTGIGKTMILDAMTFALYGKSSGHSRDDFEAMRCTNADFNTTTFVKFELENQGEHYIFERRLERKRKNLSPSYNLMKKDEDGIWRTLLENAKEKALNEKAVEIIGLEYEQFSQVIVLPQGKFERLLTSNSDDKEKILTSIFGEDKWQEIAEQLYNEVALRKDTLREKKDRISNSLKEEQCDSIAQLALVIMQKEKQLEDMDAEFETSEYEKKQKELQMLLAEAKRFGDLHRAETRMKQLEEEAKECQFWETSVADALRANRVKDLITAERTAQKELTERQQAEKSARNIAVKKEKEALEAAEQLRSHNEQASEIEEKKSLKLQYEGKKAEYESLNGIQHLLQAAEKAEKAAKTEEKKAQQSLDEYARKILELQNAYGMLDQEHKELLEGYLAGITGEIADQLIEGKPCPVCGSTSHPHKAVKADHHITKAMVDEKKQEAEEKYSILQKTLEQQLDAKKVYEEKHELCEKKHNEVIAAEAKWEGTRKNLVEGIETLTELEKAVKDLEDEIKVFDQNKVKLEAVEQSARESYTKAVAKLDPAKEEAVAAEEKLQKAKEAVRQGLKEHKFHSEKEAEALMLETEEIEKLRAKIAHYQASVETAKEHLNTLTEELAGKTEPDEHACNEQLHAISDAQNLYAKNRGILDSEIHRLKAKRKNLETEGEGIEDRIREAEEDFAFAKKLRGDSGTGLQRYVLGIMFSSVVAAANQMLELVHGGRYRLYRSDDKAQGTNKRGLELKVFDKNSEDHEGRFVSTLSGGEKFLASLALSIGMSTVAQKSGIKIEALFIDEGFGSLDEDSIGDAMNVLNSIQQANGLVGIISHVQLLQDRIPTKLKVEEIEKGSHIVQTIG